MKKRYIMCFILILLFFSPVNLFVVNVNASWWDTDFEFYKTITIDHDYIDNSLTNFPILVVIDDTTADKCNGGNSIRFIDSDETTEYYYEIEKWVDNEDRLVWVNVTSIPYDVDTVFKMYYGNSGASDNQNPTDVWDSNFLAVYHLDETSGNCLDSTINANHGTFLGNLPTRIGGSIGYGQDLTVVGSDYISLPSGCHNPLMFTWETWFKADSSSAYSHLITDYKDGSNIIQFQTTNANEVKFRGWYSGGLRWDLIPSDTYGTTWHYIAGSVQTNDATLNLDGTQIGYDTTVALIDFTFTGMWVGKHGTDPSYSDGVYDEIRISKIRRINAWLKASYHSQKNTAGFFTFGSEQTQNEPPTISNENPDHGSTDIAVQPIINVTISDLEGDVSVCNFYTSTDNVSWVWRQTNSSILNESIEYNYIQASSYSTLYYWKVTANDTNYNVSSIFNFTTVANTPPVISNENPLHNSVDIALQPTVNVTITDSDGDTCTCNFYTSTDNITWNWRQTNTNILDESIEYNYVQASNYSTLYYWKVTANDTNYNISSIYNFTTKNESSIPPIISNESPSNNSINISLFPVLSITISDENGDNMNITWLSNASGTWENIGYVLSNVSNGTYYQKFTEFAIYGLTYYWNVSVTDGIETTVSNASSFTAESTPTDSNGNGDNDDIGLLGIFGFLGYLAYRRLRKRKE